MIQQVKPGSELICMRLPVRASSIMLVGDSGANAIDFFQKAFEREFGATLLYELPGA